MYKSYIILEHDEAAYDQYADDTQTHLAMCANNSAAGLSVLIECTTDVPAERPTAQPGQGQSSHRQDDQSAACGNVIHVICVHGRS